MEGFILGVYSAVIFWIGAIIGFLLHKLQQEQKAKNKSTEATA